MIIDIHRHYHLVEGELEEYVARARALGIEKVGLSTCGPLFNQYDNEGVLMAQEQYPDLFIGFGYVKLGIDGPEKVDWLYNHGFAALKMIMPKVEYDDRSLWPIYERAQALGMPCNIHCGILGRLRNEAGHDLSSRRMRPIHLDAVLRSFPDLKILMPHLGQPWYDEAWAMLATYDNLYWDLTGCRARTAGLRCNCWLILDSPHLRKFAHQLGEAAAEDHYYPLPLRPGCSFLALCVLPIPCTEHSSSLYRGFRARGFVGQ